MNDKNANEFVDHVRLVHFALIACCAGLLLGRFNDRQSPARRALNDVRSIRTAFYEIQGGALHESLSQLTGAHKDIKVPRNLRGTIELLDERGNPTPSQVIAYPDFVYSDKLNEALSCTQHLRPDGKTLSSFVKMWDSLSDPNECYALFAGKEFRKGFKHNRGYVANATHTSTGLRDESSQPLKRVDFTFNVLEAPNPKSKYELAQLDWERQDYGNFEVVLFLPSQKLFLPFTDGAKYLAMPVQERLGAKYGWRNGSFSDSFPDLDQLTKDYRDLRVEQVERILEGEANRSVENIEAFGLKIPGTGLRTFGVILILTVQFYFSRHLRYMLSHHIKTLREVKPAWIGLYDDVSSRCAVGLTTSALPTFSVVVLVWGNLSFWSIAGGSLSLVLSVSTLRSLLRLQANGVDERNKDNTVVSGGSTAT
jgi:hypothetical protein